MTSESAGFPERYIGLTGWVHLLKAWPGVCSHEAYQVLASVAVRVLCNLVGCALGDYQPATLSPFRAKIHDPVSALDHIEMVLDDDDRVAVAPESEQHLDELVDISQSEACGWLI